MDNLAVVTEENPVEIRLRATAQELCASAEEVLIFSRPDLSNATDLVKTIKSRYNEIEAERKRLVEPFNTGVKAINGRFKAMTLPLEEAETALKAKMLAFQREEEKRANEEAARIAKVLQEAEAKRLAEQVADETTLDRPELPAAQIAVVAPAHRPTTYGQTGAVSTVKKVWAFELTDIAALAAARPDLVQVDTVRINQEIRGKGGEIPGLRIYENEIMQVR